MKRPRPSRPSRSTPIVVRSVSYRPLDLVGKRGPAAFPAPHRTQLHARTDGNEIRKKQPIPFSDPFCLLLPLPPSINHQYATVQGRRVLSSAGRRFKTQVGQEVLCALAGRRSDRPLTETLNGAPLALDLRFYFASALRRDIDGGLKITQDAVCEALGINDNRIIEVTLHKDIDTEAPRMELSLRRVPPPVARGVSSSLR